MRLRATQASGLPRRRWAGGPALALSFALVACPVLARAQSQAEEPGGAETPGDLPESPEAEDSKTPEAGDPPAEPPSPAKPPRLEQLLDPSNVEDPVFPDEQVRYLDGIRMRFQSQIIPKTDFGVADIATYRPNVRLRLTLPLSKRAVLQLSGRWETSRYDVSSGGDLLGLTPLAGAELGGLYGFETDLQGAVLLNRDRHFIVEGEKWSVLGDVFVASRWEDGAFSDAVTWGGALALGYEIPRLRIGLGGRVGTQLADSGIAFSPLVTIRWIPTNRITLRNRGLGLQIEYVVTNTFELFAAGYQNNRSYLLRQRGAPFETTLRDEQILAGLGFEWRLGKHFRLNAEVGAVAKRKIKLSEHNHHTLLSIRGDPTAYLEVRVEVRP